jgi:nucleotide-binding universal stress UspA family protein
MFERILVPLDGSELAEAVLTQVRRILFHLDAEVLLMQAVATPPSVEGDFRRVQEHLESRSSEYLEGLRAKMADQGARVRWVARQGPVAETILQVAQAEEASLIALSTHGRTGLARFVLGSIAEKVMRASPIPVLALRSYADTGRDSARTSPRELPIQKILVAIDAADLSLEVVPPALELAALFGSSVLLVNVCEGHPACSMPVPQMTRAFDQFREAGVPAEPLMVIGDPASGILDACQKHGADLLALCTHGRTGLSRWFLGSVAEKVLRTATVPLLIVRSPRAVGGSARAVKKEGEAKA